MRATIKSASKAANPYAPICPVFRTLQKPDDAIPLRKIRGGNHVNEIQSPSLHRRRYGSRRDALPRARGLGARPLAVAANPHGLQLPGGRADRPAGARLRRLHLQAGGQNVIIENKAGASGSIGAAEVARAAPDGLTILCSISTTYVMNRVMMKNPGYDMDKDLTLVSVIPGAGLLLIASQESGVKSLDEFVAFARKKRQVNFGTYSAGSAPHMTINELNKQYGLNIEPIHYRGEAPMWTGLMDGTLDVAMGSYTAAQSVLQSNKGILFAVHSRKVPAIPDVKTLPEQGATSKFFTVSGFSGWALPKATPQPIVDRLAELSWRPTGSESEGSSRHFRAGSGARLQGNQCPVSARSAGLGRGRASARLSPGLKLAIRSIVPARSRARFAATIQERIKRRSSTGRNFMTACLRLTSLALLAFALRRRPRRRAKTGRHAARLSPRQSAERFDPRGGDGVGRSCRSCRSSITW